MPPRSRYTYDSNLARYRDPSGRFVSGTQVREALDSALRQASQRIAALGNDLREGSISLIRWEQEMRLAIKDVHLYSRALARGGWDRMTQADFGAVGRALKDQYSYLNRFAAEIERGLPFDGRFTLRVMMYAQAARKTYYAALTDEMDEAGMTEERNVLTSAEHCIGEGSCTNETARGWVPLGELIPVGDRLCISNCRCMISYR